MDHHFVDIGNTGSERGVQARGRASHRQRSVPLLPSVVVGVEKFLAIVGITAGTATTANSSDWKTVRSGATTMTSIELVGELRQPVRMLQRADYLC